MNNSDEGALVHSLLDEAVAEAPGSRAVRDPAGEWTYDELAAYSHAVAATLYRLGVRRGDRVVVQLQTTRELVALFFGVSRLGAVFVPLNPAMKPFHLRSVIENAEPVMVVAMDSAVAAIAGATEVAVCGFELLWGDVLTAHTAGEQAPTTTVDPDDIAVLIYTSGSTAAPKGVIGPHRQVTFASRVIQAVLGYRGDDVVFCRFPMSWDYGLYKVLLSTLGRSEIVLAGTESDLVLLKRMREVGATVLPIVPSLASMIAILAERDTAPPPPIRLITNTGAALPDATVVKLRAAFPDVRVVRQFGQTECKRITIMPPDEDQERPGSSGVPLPGTSVLIVNSAGEEVPPGDIGEIVATGPHVMPGYWRAPEISAHAFRRDEHTGELRLHTGDYGRVDEDGYLYFEGRRDDMFKVKGIRMSTLEIEAAAMDIPGVRAAGAIPPSENRELALCVETDLPPHTVLRELAKRLEPQKVPSICHVVEQFPLTAHGKNATKELAKLLEGART
ncbi:acyl-CoA synthetase (AMP-forming)/AMP-acid ligase II [Kibdelosporangium banguiense]|uniref:Acyl-CoA synthetase (AMP-forming)/AMP-acid ligase II n=1 Tax=Kibdelosporangium banguiense TaxID=1365924 RepID=A0ABS4TRT2_9PSEU|nr:AMP-binding protein [Kibdelosporangium banguiense]MBP2327112.1 acyl-CoA synthetase (AMP-forming)/AMP-acid ligase II [Kibdelosporangium banguiense]